MFSKFQSVAIVSLTSTLCMFLELDMLPFFRMKVILLRHISVNFFKYILFYNIPILGFFSCFYMLLDNKKNFFSTLYKIITMFAGDPDLGFIVIIGIILHNLLIGLAVSDLQEILKEVELIYKKEYGMRVAYGDKYMFELSTPLQKIPLVCQNIINRITKRNVNSYKRRCIMFGEEEPCFIVRFQSLNKAFLYLKKDYRKKELLLQDKNTVISLHRIFRDLLTKNDYVDPNKMLNDRLTNIELLLLYKN